MPYEPLHHKYRPQTFKDLVGQETIALTLSNALKQEKIAPAYLFTGPRGTGKTSSARILAKSLNCLNSKQPTPDPCGKCEACLAIANGSASSVIEIDAASSTGVDNIREIIERSIYGTIEQHRYKIYIIDECHMLSTAAFNALLKTLEEPPPKVVFILATTDPQRVLPTIISRCQRFDYRRIPLPEMIGHLRYIADAENIAIADEAISLIAQIANGGLRDAESLLDQLSLMPEEISVAKVWDLVGAVPEQDLLKLLQAINSHNAIEILQQCRSLLDQGREPMVVLQNLATFYLNLLIAKTAPQNPEMVAVTETCWQQLCTQAQNWDTALILHGQQHLRAAETQLKQTTQPRLWLEVTLLGLLPQAQLNVVPQPANIKQAQVSSQAQSIPEPKLAVFVADPAIQARSQTAVAKTEEQPAIPNPVAASHTKVAPVASTLPPVEPREVITTLSATPPQAEPANLQPAVEIANNAVDNQEIWQKVVSCLKPPTTQALLKQQCFLVSFDGVSAIVGISSAKLQKLNQGKVPNIEAAFAQVCQRKVKVQLEVAAPKKNLKATRSTQNQNVSASPTAPQAVVSQPPSTVNHASFGQPATVPISQPTVLPPLVEQKENFNQSPKTQFRPNSGTDGAVTAQTPSLNNLAQSASAKFDSVSTTQAEVDSVSPLPLATLDLGSEATDDYLQQAIDSLAQSFEGELVDMANMQNELAEAEELPTVETIDRDRDRDRPDPEDYADDW